MYGLFQTHRLLSRVIWRLWVLDKSIFIQLSLPITTRIIKKKKTYRYNYAGKCIYEKRKRKIQQYNIICHDADKSCIWVLTYTNTIITKYKFSSELYFLPREIHTVNAIILLIVLSSLHLHRHIHVERIQMERTYVYCNFENCNEKLLCGLHVTITIMIMPQWYFISLEVPRFLHRLLRMGLFF